MTKEQDQKRIDAVLVERAGSARAGRKDRLAAVDAELKRLGYEFPDVPKGRSSAEAHKSKADQPSEPTVKQIKKVDE